MRYIIHLSDIHIRKGDIQSSRYAEYNTVFDNLFESIKEKTKSISSNDFIIIMTGDIFHDKNLIGNYGLTLYKKLIKGLTSLGRVIMFHGNHDRNQSDIEQPSLISSTIEIDNLILLHDTQSFVIDDVGFSYVSIDDTLDTYANTGRISDLPPFPSISGGDTKHKIALFHGTFANVKINHTQEATSEYNPYPFEWIQDFDFALLGDIHLRQKGLFKSKTLWGYAGSLIQQNFGEEIIEHGYMIWDLHSRKIESINVYNERGMINIKQTNDEIYVRQGMQYNMPLDILLSNPMCPKHLEIKVYSEINSQKLHDILRANNKQYHLITYKLNRQSYEGVSESDNDVYIDKHVILKYFAPILSQEHYQMLHDIMRNYDALLLNKDRYPAELHDDCMKKNKELSGLIANCIQSDEVIAHKGKFTITYLEWDNLYCYESKNFIHFDEALYNTLLIAGSNGTGKSAIYDIITLAIWGDITKCKQNALTCGIVNYKHTKGQTMIHLTVNDITYKICREFLVAKDKNVLHRPIVSLYRNDELLKRNSACNDEINKIFGTLDEFLATSMITQNMDYNILDLSWKDCVSTIDKATNIHYVNDLYTLFKGCSNKYKDFVKTIESKKQVYANIIATTPSTALAPCLDIVELHNKKQRMVDENNSIAIDMNHPVVQDILMNKYDVADILDDITDIETLHSSYNELQVFFKNHTPDQINNLRMQPNNNVQLDAVYKPCEYSYILQEEQELQGIHVSASDELILQNKLKDLQQLNETHIILPMHQTPIPTSNDFMTEIIDIFQSIEVLHEFCTKNPQSSASLNPLEKLYLKTYEKYKQEHEELQRKIIADKEELMICHRHLDELYMQQTTTEQVQEPDTTYMHKHDVFKHDIDALKLAMKQDEESMAYLHKELDKIKDIELELLACKNELNVFQNNDEYAYDPMCQYCCKRPWVNKLKELQTKKTFLEKNINNAYAILFDKCQQDYLETYIRHENNKSIIAWRQYYKYQDICDCVKSSVQQKDELQQHIHNNEVHLNVLQDYINRFLKKAHSLYHVYLYHTYSKWKQLNEEIHQLQRNLMYLPRIQKLTKLKSSYAIWYDYNRKVEISNAHKIHDIKMKITAYEKSKEYDYYMRMKPMIARKMELIHMINDMDIQITESIKTQTISDYNKSNKLNHDMLCNSLDTMNNMLMMLDTVVDKFKQYRKDLYDTFILRNLVTKANKYIKILCHTDTKAFEVNYLITEHKDSIHINWLIQNLDVATACKQIISVCQASGFQRFVISLALRMSLYGNKRCEQIFIDEGFTSCDKKNLSMVPNFLKGLLQEYKGVIVMSHIDIIEENIEKKARIIYNKNSKTSCIQYTH